MKKPIKIECDTNDQQWLIDIIADNCRGEFSIKKSCGDYPFCDDCLKDNIIWIIREGDN